VVLALDHDESVVALGERGVDVASVVGCHEEGLAQAGITKGGGGGAIQLGTIWLPFGFEQKAGKAAPAVAIAGALVAAAPQAHAAVRTPAKATTVTERQVVLDSYTASALSFSNPIGQGLIAGRIDMGVDFSGSGPIYALGDAVVTDATAAADGWPGGGWITYQLTDGPDAGLMVYVAEDVQPTVVVGQRVTHSTVIADMFNGSDGIETGWAQPTQLGADSELPEATAPEAGGLGFFPTAVGVNFDLLLQSLGIPAAPNFGQTASGYVPAIYPANGG